MSEAPNEQLIAVQNKVADLTEALAVTQGVVAKINTMVTNISSMVTDLGTVLTNTNTAITNIGTVNNNLGFITEDLITPFSKASVGGVAGDLALGTLVSAASTANLAVYVPFALTASKTAYKMFCFNGTSVAGNIDVGIYSSAGTRLVSMGATAQSGTTTNQTFNIADTALAAGQYFMAISFSSTGAVYQAQSTVALPSEYFNIRRQTSAHPLPATATFDAVANGLNLPLFGVALRSDFA